MVITIEFGALSDPISDQLKHQCITIPEDDARRLQEMAHCVVYLHLHNIIPDSVRDSARKKIMKKIVSVVRTQP